MIIYSMLLRFNKRFVLLAAIIWALFACGGGDNSVVDVPVPPTPNPPATPPVTVMPVPAFDEDGVLSAKIRWTDYGVPHVLADNLESLTYGVGYAFARDNICVLADQIVKYNSERAKYFGPHRNPQAQDSEHLINDFGFKTIGIRDIAEERLSSLSDNTRAMLSGYTKGYNKYLTDNGIADIDPVCANQAWVKPIDEFDLFTYSLGIALLPGAENFLAAMFAAAPPGESFLPRQAAQQKNNSIKMSPHISLPELNPQDLGSNGWGLGADMTENGMGMVLANPHFPHTGNLRFWQFHTTIPGHLNVIGGSLMGVPGAVNIGFNENIAWTHTFSTAEHFVVYQLSLDESDTQSLTHTVDGNQQAITTKEISIEVAVAPGVTQTFVKDTYHTNYGPMIVVPGNFEWGPNSNAYAIKDANLPNVDIVDHWLAMNLASNMEEFKQAFRDFDGVIFNNTMAASKDGEVFYIDDSTVPNLSTAAIDELTTNSTLINTRGAAGFTVLPGALSQFDFDGSVPFENAPQYSGTDYVQNSNDSFWLTNLNSPIVVANPMYGDINNQQSLRSRMAHKLLDDASGSDGKFNMNEVIETLMSNRSYLSENILPELLTICNANRDTPVAVEGALVSLGEACTALSSFDGTMNLDSVGAHVFREFAFQFRRNPQWVSAFDVNDPINTPSGLMDNELSLQQLAAAVKKVNDAGIALDATLGQVQFVEKSTATGEPSGKKLPWGGAHNVEGGFNVFDVRTANDGTELPTHRYPTLDNSTRLSAEAAGYHITSGSSWMYVVNFTENGPMAQGLLTYSQSHSPNADSFDDQTMLYSSQPQLRPIFFTEEDIAANLVEEITISSVSND